MAESILIFERRAAALSAERFSAMAGELGLKGETVATEHALALRDGTRALAYAQQCGVFAGLLFFADQSVAWGEPSGRVIAAERARGWGRDFLRRFELMPNEEDDKARLELTLDAAETDAIVFDGRERRRMKTKTDVISKITLNGVPVIGPRAKVRMVFKEGESPVMLHAGLWRSLSVYEERELVRAHDVVRTVQDKLAQRADCNVKNYDIRDVMLAYVAGEYKGGPDLLAPEYLVEVELRDPRYTGRDRIQGPRQVIRLPAYR